MRKLSKTKQAIKMRKMRREESQSDKKKRLHHNKMLKISSQYLYAKNNSPNRKYRNPTQLEKKAIEYRIKHFNK